MIDRETLKRIVARYGSIVRRYATYYGVPPELVFGIIYVESRGNPKAVAPSTQATGLMQIWWPAAVDTGFVASKEEFFRKREKLFDPEINIQYGVKYLARLREYFLAREGRYPNFFEWARMYYGGPKGYKKWQTEGYGRKVLRAIQALRALA